MAQFLTSKAPAEVVERRWSIPVDKRDNVTSASVSASGVTVDAYELECDDLVLTLSAGTAAMTGTITVTVTTQQGQSLTETIYIPVVADGSSAQTCRDMVDYALRKIYGLGETAPADAADHALECLADMLTHWKETGADIGAAFPLTLNTVLYTPDSHLLAVKNNLIIAAADLFDREVSASVGMAATRGLQHIKQSNLPDERCGADYY